MGFNSISQPASQAMNEVLFGVLNFLPKLIGALILLLVGWGIGVILGRFVAQFFRTLKLDNLLKNVGVEKALARGGFDLDTGGFFGTIVKWFFIIVGLIAGADVLGLSQVNLFLDQVVTTVLPNVVVAAIILIVGALVAHAVHKLVTGSARAAEVPAAHFMGGIAKWAVWIFTILAALDELSIATPFTQVLWQGIVAALAISLGLAFGLGGKDAAARYIEHLRKDVVDHR